MTAPAARSREPGPLSFDYFDASDDPLARRAAATPPEVLDALETLGCVCVGHALAVLRLNGIELVTEVWRTPDERALIELEPRTGRAELATWFADGTIVRTLQRPTWWQWIHAAPGARNHPADRHASAAYVGTLPGVAARHRARVAEMEGRAGGVVPAADLRAHFAMRRRAAELRDARMVPQLTLALVMAVALGLAGALATLRALKGAGPSPPGAAVLAVLAAHLVAIPVHYVAKWFVAPWVVRLRRGPPARPAADMLAQADVPRGRLRRED